MTRHLRPVVLLLLLATFSVGCEDAASPGLNRSERMSATAAAPTARGLDRVLQKFGERNPGFGGLYLSGGRIIVHSTTGADAAQMGRNVVDLMRSHRLPFEVSESDVQFVSAQYEFADLLSWKEAIVRNSDAIITFADVDDRTNRIVIGVNDMTSELSIGGLVDELGIPASAVEVVERAPVPPMSVLTQHHRPLRGALAVSGTFDCTLGYVVEHLDYSGEFLLVNSHCTGFDGGFGVDSTVFCQPISCGHDPADRVGQEAVDPPTFACSRGPDCRNSDAALIRLDSASLGDVGYLTHTGDRMGQSISDPNPSYPSIAVGGRYGTPWVGLELDRLGKTSGWTYGEVLTTCSDELTIHHNWLLCQSEMDSDPESGDSGGPIFYWFGSGTAEAYGILYGGTSTSIFSPMAQIEDDLGILIIE